MEPVEVQPICTMSGSDMLTALDAVQDELTRLSTYRLELLDAFEQGGHAAALGAKDTVELLSFRHRLTTTEVRADLKLATALSKYPAVQAALPRLLPEETADGGYFLHLGQARAIVTGLEKIPSSAKVPVEDLEAAERELVRSAQHLNPADLARAANQARDILDTDGPEPAENAAYDREALWYRKTDGGIRLGGFLAAENAELFTTSINAGAKPHQTTDGRPDPRGRDKRQADAMVTVFNTAATGSGNAGPHITVTIDYDALKNATAAATTTHPNTPTHTATADTATADGPGPTADAARGTTTADAARDATSTSTSTSTHAARTKPDKPSHNSPATDARRLAAGERGADADSSETNNAHRGAAATTDSPSSATATDQATLTAPSGAATGSAADRPDVGREVPLPFRIDAASNGFGELVYGDNLSASAVRRLACDAGVLPVVLGSNSQPLDVGTEKRFVTPPIRAALIARDKGCVICGAPPIMCDAHHITHWIDGGPTSLCNLALLCKLHHRELHRGQWTITIPNGIPQITRPPWATRPPPHRRLNPPLSQPATPAGRPSTHAQTPSTTPPSPRKWPHTTDPTWPPPAHIPRPNPWSTPTDTPPPQPPSNHRARL